MTNELNLSNGDNVRLTIRFETGQLTDALDDARRELDRFQDSLEPSNLAATDTDTDTDTGLGTCGALRQNGDTEIGEEGDDRRIEYTCQGWPCKRAAGHYGWHEDADGDRWKSSL